MQDKSVIRMHLLPVTMEMLRYLSDSPWDLSAGGTAEISSSDVVFWEGALWGLECCLKSQRSSLSRGRFRHALGSTALAMGF
jgi:hypothetical protein